ncbi:unnamed protein product [Paramecium primaurelia]|uniref:Uncharacterized protein n=1 Tax=Paramecium primaurelia TaxID=5886 RepID=A0A8S1P6J7_PARPR|nr:unnamed protein product [Paramecium primaurelia]
MQQICDFHLRFIKQVCCENQCSSKLLCDECIKQNNDHAGHRLVDLQQFMNLAEQFLKGGYPEVVLYGADLNTKTKIYVSNTQDIKQEMQAQYVKILEDQIQKYINQLVDGIKQGKKMIIDFVNSIIEESFSSAVLNNRECSHMIVKGVLQAFEQKISTKDGNNLLYRLHTGQLEKDYYEKKIQGLVELFQTHLQQILEPLGNQVENYAKQFLQQMEKVKVSVKNEHFNMNRTNMLAKQFKIKDMVIDQNLQLKVEQPNYISRKHNVSLPPPLQNESEYQNIFKLKTARIPKQRKLELLKSLDFMHHTARSDSNMQTISQITPQKAKLDNAGQDLKRIMVVNSIHQNLLDVISIQGNICMTSGKEGTLNLFTIQIEGTDISIINQHQIKPHQELRDVEVCQTPGMFLTVGRNIKVTNEKYVDLGYIVKLFLFQDIKDIELLTEFRDLHNQPIEKLKFINENYIRTRIEYSKFSNELEFASQTVDTIKVWKFSFDSSKIYEGEMQEMYKIEVKQQIIKCIEFSNDFLILTTKQNYSIYHKTTLIKQQVQGKDFIVKSKVINNNRVMILSNQGVITILDMLKIKNNEKSFEPQKINIKKYLRLILFEKEEKEVEFIDCIQINQKFLVFMHSTVYDYFLTLNKNFEVENRYRYPPSEIRLLKCLEFDKYNLIISVEGKNDFGIWNIVLK